MSQSPDAISKDPRIGGIWSPSFQGLLWTQWLTAINDNVFRWFVIGVGKDQFTPENMVTLLVVGSACFTLPYILFASVAGWLADRFEKSKVIVGCKIAEIVIMGLGVMAVLLLDEPDPAKGIDNSFYLLLAAVFFMGLQSALFAPAKVGTIPELLDEETISKGNGIFNLATLSATVIGMAMGGWLSDITQRGQQQLWIAAVVLVGIAIIGTLLSLLIRSLPAANQKAKFPITLVGDTFRDIGTLVGSGPLFRVALGIVFFWSIAAFAQINIDFFSEESGALIESHRTPLLIAVTMGIGFGSLLAGYISAGRIELGLVPFGAAGIAFFAALLCFAPADFINEETFGWGKIVACLMLAGLGISAGVFDVPLASYLQHNSPIENRGSILAATNCLAFTGVLVMFALLQGLRSPANDGTLANASTSLSSINLTADERSQIDGIVDVFKDSPLSDPPSLKPFVDRVPENLQSSALVELAFHDATRRKADDQSVMLDNYKEEFPDENSLRLIKKAIVQSGKQPLFSSRQTFLILGLMTLPVFLFAAYRLSKKMVRLLFVWLLKSLYRIRIRGMENIPDGPAILVVNHQSWLDGALPLALIPQVPRAIAYAGNFQNKLAKRWADFCGVILITGGPKSIRRGLETAQQALENGELLVVFAEGGITRSGQIRTLKPGIMKIRDKVSREVPIVPIFIDELWGSVFSYSGGKALYKWPNSFRRPISMNIGKPIADPKSMFEVRDQLLRLSSDSVEHRAGKFVAPAAAFIKQCKRRRFKSKIADSTGQEETGGKLLTRALVLRRLLRKHVLDASDKNIGVLIPPTIGGAIVNLTLGLDRRIAINLNYSLSEELINFCIKKAGIKYVLTSRKVMEKFEFNLECEVYYLDDLKDKVTGLDKAIGAFQAFALPAWIHKRMLGLGKIKADDLMTIVFTSGSTGVPKGVMLSQRNIASNMDAIERVGAFKKDDTMIGILPFFHSFGYTATLWAAMGCNIRGAYHFSPLDSRQVGKLVQKFKGTILVATPTFLRSYMRRCSVEEFESLDMVVAGAERLPPELCDQFEEKYGVRPVEGYGATELSPIVAVNIPAARDFDKFQIDRKEGTVGRTIPNVAVKVVDLDSNEELAANQSGMLWFKGPNVMQGYLDLPDKTAEVLVDGWYKTGDVGLVDEDGFVKITGRISRFSKIGGEMVPHVKVEELLTKMVDETPNDDTDDQPLIAVTAIADEKKGERLIVLHAKISKSVDELRAGLKEAGLPNIFIPSADSFRQVESLPLLGSGKIDLKGIKVMAENEFDVTKS